MGIIEQIMAWKFAGGFGVVTIAGIILWMFRVIMAYLKETREEYIDRLRETAFELEQQKTINIRLEMRYRSMELMHSLTGKDDQ